MAEIIKDGTGGGYTVRVGTSNKLDVSSRVNDRIYYASRDDAKAFIAQFAMTQAVGAAAEAVGYIKYTGEGRMNIKQIALSTEEPDTTAWGIWKSPTTSGGGAVTPVNLNFGSNNPSEVEAKDDTTALTLTGGSSLFTVRMDGPFTKIIPFYDAVILGTNDIIGIKGNADTAGSKLRVNIMYSESID